MTNLVMFTTDPCLAHSESPIHGWRAKADLSKPAWALPETVAVALLNVFVFSRSTFLDLWLLIAFCRDTNTKEDSLNFWTCSHVSRWEMACLGTDAYIYS